MARNAREICNCFIFLSLFKATGHKNYSFEALYGDRGHQKRKVVRNTTTFHFPVGKEINTSLPSIKVLIASSCLSRTLEYPSLWDARIITASSDSPELVPDILIAA